MSDLQAGTGLAAKYVEFLLSNPEYRPLASSTKLYKALKTVDMGPEPPVKVPNTWRMILRWTGPDGALAENVMYGQAASYTGVQSQVNAISGILGGVAVGPSGLHKLVSSHWSLTSAICQDVHGTGNFFSTPYTFAGTDPSTGAALPPNVAAVISWDVDKKYKGGHPRTYIPGIAETNTDNPGGKLWTAQFTANLKTFGKAFLDALVQNLTAQFSGALVGTLSKRAGYVWKNPPEFWQFIDTKSHPRVDTQRRRLGKEITAG